MRLQTSQLLTVDGFKLSTGASLPQLDIAYETWGTLAPDGNNAILLCHGYTNHPHAGGDKNGWFSNLMGPGKAVDTDKYFVVCSNMLGSAFGTSGPQSTNPETDRPFGPNFPKFTTRDQVAVQKRLIDHLGIGQLKAVIGNSWGGHLTFLWGCLHPDRMRSLVSTAGMIERTTNDADIARINAQFEDCPGWNEGHYYAQEPDGGVVARMTEIRYATLTKYGQATYLADTLDDPSTAEAILRSRAKDWAKQFDANSLAAIYAAGIGSSAIPNVADIQAPFLHVLANSDSVVDVATGPPTVELMRTAGVDVTYVEIDTPYGHNGPMLDASKWDDRLRTFLSATP